MPAPRPWAQPANGTAAAQARSGDGVIAVGGGSAIDPQVIARLLPGAGGPLSPREREVLVLVARGWSNSAIAGQLFLTERTVESHVRAIFTKLGIPEDRDAHRRVHAVLKYLGKDGPDQQV